MSSATPSLALRPFLAALTLLPAALHATTELHVSPGGNDAHPGTVAMPLASPQGAQMRVRSLIQAGLNDAVNVVFSAGTYAMTGEGLRDLGCAARALLAGRRHC